MFIAPFNFSFFSITGWGIDLDYCDIELFALETIFFKSVRDTKGTFHAKMGTIKDSNGMDLTKAEDIKKRWQEYTGELYKKNLQDPDNHDGVITHLEPVSWNVKSSGP